MRFWHIFRSRITSVLRRSHREDDLSEELRLHLERQAEQWIAQGVDPEEARLRARRQFGNVESLKEQSRDARGTARWDALVRDTRHAARRLVRDWRFSAPAVLLLALGIGANTAIFSIVNGTFFRPLPFADPDRLVNIYQNDRDGAPTSNSFPAYQDMAAATSVFAHVMTATIPMPVSYRDGRGPVRSGIAEYTTMSYPAVLGLQPSLGRWFTADEDRLGAPAVVVIGHQAWTRRFGADPRVIGRTVFVQGVEATVVGVGPREHRGTFNAGVVTDLWLPAQSALGPIAMLRVPQAPFFAKARLRDGVTVEQAQAAMDALGRRLAQEYPNLDAGTGISVFATPDVRVHPSMDTAVNALASLVLAVVGLVMAVACSNLATLLLVRAAARVKEVSIRLALGASRRQVIRHLLTESLLLSLAGGAAGCALAWWLMRSLRAIELPITIDYGVDAAVLAYAIALSLATGMLFGLAPALKATRFDLVTVIRDGGQTLSSGGRWFTLRNGLVVLQVTASVVLLAATGAFMQMGGAAGDRPLGFAVDGVAWLDTDARYSGYTAERAAALYEELRRRVEALPGVEAVTLTQGRPMESATTTIAIEDPSGAPRVVSVSSMWAGPGFFDVMQIPLLAGRTIDERDRRESPKVVVITESMARRHFGDVNALGRRFRPEFGEVSGDPRAFRPGWMEVVGVVSDVAGGDYKEVFFQPVEQADAGAIAILPPRTIAARTSGDAPALVRGMQRELLALDSSLPVFVATTLEEQRRTDQDTSGPRVVAMALGALGALGLVLAGIGLYAVIAFAVSRQAREIGIRIALGAQNGDVVRGVARDALAVLGVGAALGLAFAFMVIMGLRASSDVSVGIVNIDFKPPSMDPLQVAVIIAFVLVVGVAAAFVPARRASRMSPLAALREE